MSLGFLEQARNESMARRELTIQSHCGRWIQYTAPYSAIRLMASSLMHWRQLCISLTPCFIMLTASASQV